MPLMKHMGARTAGRIRGNLLLAAFAALATLQCVAAQFDNSSIPQIVKLRFMSSRMKVLEGSQSEIRILAIGAITENFTVNLKFTPENNNTFFTDGNFTGFNVEVQFTVGETQSSPATLTTATDEIWEGVEELSVTFDLPPNMTNIQKGVPATLTVAIEDDDEIKISFVGNDTICIREDIGTYPFQLKASGFYARVFTVRVACFEVDSDNTATESDDYNLRKERVEFMESDIGKGESTSTNAELVIVDDDISEGDETFICVILLPTGQQADGRVVGEPDTISIIIKDNDKLEIGFEHSTYMGTEGEEVRVRLVATSEFAKAFQVEIFTTSLLSSSPEKPYEAESADYAITPDTGRVRFNPILGRASSELLIDLETDCLVEGTEYFDLSVNPVSDNETSITLGDKSRIRVVITDINAVYVRPEFSMHDFDEDEFVSVRYEALYETSGTYMPVNSECYYNFGFNLEVSSEDITAKANMDYIEIINERVHFNAGERYSSNLSVTLIDDDIAEPTESFKLNYNINVTRSEEDAGSVLKLINSSKVIIRNNDVAIISFNTSTLTFREDFGVFELNLITDTVFQHDQIIHIKITDGTAESDIDFKLLTDSVKIQAEKSESEPIRVQIIDDEMVEDTESFNVSFTLSPSVMENFGVVGNISEVDVFIEDQDLICIQFVETEYAVNESAGMIYVDMIVYNGTVVEPFIVNLVVQGGTDLYIEEVTHYFVTFDVGKTMSSRASILIIDDSEFVGNITLTIVPELDNKTAEKVKVLPPFPMVTVIEDDEIFIEFAETVYDVEESAGTFSVVMNVYMGTVVEPFNVTLEVEGGTAMVGYDYLITSESIVTFEADETISTGGLIIIIADGIYEGNETITISAQLDNETARGVRILPPFPTITLIDDDVLFNFELDNIQVEENVGFFNVCVVKTGTRNTETSVLITPSDTDMDFSGFMADGGDDYDDSVVEIIFQPNDTVVCVDIPIIDDSVLEQNETFIVNLVRPIVSSGVEIGNMNKSFLTIQNDDKIFVQFSTDSITVNEGDGIVEIMLQSGLSDVPYSVVVTPSTGSAIADMDFSSSSLFANFDVRERNTTLFISIIADSLIEPPETFTLDITIPPYAAQLGVGLESPHTMTITITDTDCVIVSLDTDQIQVSEGNSYHFTVEARGMFVAPFNVEIMPVEMSATDEEDFDTTTLLVTFNPGESKKELSIKTEMDGVNEGPETFRIELVVDLPNVNGTNICTEVDSLLVNISDIDNVLVKFEFEEYNVREGNDLAVRLLLFGKIERAIFIDIVAMELNMTGAYTATGGDDFIQGAVNVTFLPESRANITSTEAIIYIEDDDILEGTELFQLFIRSTEELDERLVDLLDPKKAFANIMDDDTLEVCFENAAYIIDEDNGTLEIRVCTNRSDFTANISLNIEAVSVSAQADLDFPSKTYTATLSPGSRCSEPINVEVNVDAVLEEDETFELKIMVPSETDYLGVLACPTAAKVTIVNDDCVEVSFGIDKFEALEKDGEAMISVKMDGASELEVNLSIKPSEFSSVDAEGGGIDFDDTEIQFTIPATTNRSSEQVVPIFINSDSIAELQEMFSIDLIATSLSPACLTAKTGALSSATVTILDDTRVTVQLDAVTKSIVERAGAATFRLTKLGLTSFDFNVTVSTNCGLGLPDEATADLDYNSTEMRLNFSANVMSLDFSVPVIDDNIREGKQGEEEFSCPKPASTENLGVCILEVDSERVDIEGSPSTSATIIDDDLEFGIVEGRYPVVEEGSNVKICICKAGEREVTLTIAILFPVENDTSISLDDHSGLPSGSGSGDVIEPRRAEGGKDFDDESILLVFTPNDTLKCGEIVIYDDNVVEDFESFSYSLEFVTNPTSRKRRGSKPGDGATIVTPNGTVIILPSDQSNDKLNFSLALIPPMGPLEGNPAMIMVTVTSPFEVEFCVELEFFDLTATENVDYGNVSPVKAEFREGMSTQLFNVDTMVDELVEGTETFLVGIRVSGFEQFVLPDNISVNIWDATVWSVSFTDDNFVTNEFGDLFVTLTSSKPVTNEIRLKVRTTDVTAGPSDYGSRVYYVVFPADDIKSSINISITDDEEVEDEEYFEMAIEIPPQYNHSYSLGTYGVALGIIIDDDHRYVTLVEDLYVVNEGDHFVSVIVTVDREFSEPFEVSLQLEPSYAQPDDYGNITEYKKMFLPGIINVTFEVVIEDDALLEGEEDFYLNLVLPSSDRGLPGRINRTRVIIVDNDVNTILSFDKTNYTTEEGQTLPVVISLNYPVLFDFNVIATAVNQTAYFPVDFTGGPFELRFAEAEISKTITFEILMDDIPELTEAFTVELSFSGKPTRPIDPFEVANVQILENDFVVISLGYSEIVVNEEDGSVMIPIVSNRDSLDEMNITLTVLEREANAYEDFILLDPTFVIGPGIDINNISVSVGITEDILIEGQERFEVILSLPPGGTVRVGSINKTTVKIDDNDVVNISFADDKYVVKEYDKNFMLEIVASKEVENIVNFIEISLTNTDVNATNGIDYVLQVMNQTLSTLTRTHTLSWSPSDGTIIGVFLTIIDDDYNDDNEIFTLELSVPPKWQDVVALGEYPSVTVTIEDNEVRLVTFDVDRTSVLEGEVVVLTLTVDKPLVEPFSVEIQTSGRTAEGGDYRAGPIPVIFKDILHSHVTINTTDDDIFEMSETFDVELIVPNVISSRVKVNGTAKYEITIQDNDEGFIQFKQDTYTVQESEGSVVVFVVFDGTLDEPTYINVRVIGTDITTDTNDHSGLDGNFIFTFNDTNKIDYFTINITMDNMPELNEKFHLSLISETDRVLVGVQANVTIEIIDNPLYECNADSMAVITPFYVMNNIAPQQYSFMASCEYELITTCDGRSGFHVYADFNGNTLDILDVQVVYMGSIIEPRNENGSQIWTLDEISVTVIRTNSLVTIEILANSAIIPNMCGLCSKPGFAGFLVTRSNTMVPLANMRAVNRAAQSYLTPFTEGVIRPNRTECIRTLILRNDSIFNDPLMTVPILLNSTNEAFKDPSLCLQFHGLHNTVFNLISDSCLTVNAKYKTVEDGLNIVSELGLVAVGNNNTCHRLRVDIDGCRTWMDGELINGRKLDDGIEVINSRNRSRISVPNCDNVDLVMWVVCQHIDGVDMLKYVITRGLNLRPTSHGILGQFWNVPFNIEPYDEPYGSGSAQEVNDYYVLTMSPPLSKKRSFVAEYDYYTWDYTISPCFYAGNRQGGPLREVQDGPNDSPIQGFYRDYIVFSLFDTTPKYNRFTATCTRN